jgi:Flp pilus assembly protein TadG
MHRFLRHRGGVAAVEFALIAPVLLILLGGAVDLGRAIDLGLRLEATARIGAQVILRTPDVAENTVTSAMASAFGSTPSSPSPAFTAPVASSCACLSGSTGAATVAACTDSTITSCLSGVAKYRTVTARSSFAAILPAALVPFANFSQLSRDVTVRL